MIYSRPRPHGPVVVHTPTTVPLAEHQAAVKAAGLEAQQQLAQASERIAELEARVAELEEELSSSSKSDPKGSKKRGG